MRGVAGGLSDEPPSEGSEFVSGPVLSPDAFLASRAGTFPGLLGDVPFAASCLPWSPSGTPPTARREGVMLK